MGTPSYNAPEPDNGPDESQLGHDAADAAVQAAEEAEIDERIQADIEAAELQAQANGD